MFQNSVSGNNPVPVAGVGSYLHQLAEFSAQVEVDVVSVRAVGTDRFSVSARNLEVNADEIKRILKPQCRAISSFAIWRLVAKKSHLRSKPNLVEHFERQLGIDEPSVKRGHSGYLAVEIRRFRKQQRVVFHEALHAGLCPPDGGARAGTVVVLVGKADGTCRGSGVFTGSK